MSDVVLSADGVSKHYPLMGGSFIRRKVGLVRAVDGVDLRLRRGETLGVVGESGCGKSTLARLLVGLEQPTEGSIELLGTPLRSMGREELRRARRHVQIVMQDPYASLNPRMTVSDVISEPLIVHPEVTAKGDRGARVRELLDMVGLNPDHADRYPHQFSGGQRQRISIARALAVRPKILICDEPVSALDVSIQAQVINLLRDLQQELALTCVFIAHDLSVVAHISSRIAVMYLGKVVELGSVDAVCDTPTHPYTHALLSAVPEPDPAMRRQHTPLLLDGDVPSPTKAWQGCRFAPRCWLAADRCRHEQPQLQSLGEATAQAACHFPLDAEQRLRSLEAAP